MPLRAKHNKTKQKHSANGFSEIMCGIYLPNACYEISFTGKHSGFFPEMSPCYYVGTFLYDTGIGKAATAC